MKSAKWKENWYVILVGLLIVLQLPVFTLWGERSFVAVHDNLDLFVAHNKLMQNQHIFFSSHATANMLGGVDRDTLGGEFYLNNLLYQFLPAYTAYVVNYFGKILIGLGSFLLLAKEIYKERYRDYRGLLWLTGAGFSMIPVFPAYGIAFTSIPFVVYLFLKIYREPKPVWYLLLFCYPFVSYFSYFGFFILAYLVAAIIIVWIRDRRFPVSLGISLPVACAGYMTWEYRLFREMLFGDTVTIRSTMAADNVSLAGMFREIGDVFCNTIFHAQDSHKYWIMPVALVLLIIMDISYLKARDIRGLVREAANWVLLLIVFNCLVYGLYNLEVFRNLVETLLPPLTGFQFNRTIYFNPFLWYALFFLTLKWLWEHTQKQQHEDVPGIKIRLKRTVIYAGAAVSVLVCMFVPQVYNDFYSNCYHHAYEMLKKQESSQLSFGEFYSQELFTQIKEDIGYGGEWAIAYGMHPAVLQYNGISTLDGYLGLYPQEYKEQFARLIAPALEQSEDFRVNYESWGARAYVFSGSGENTYQPVRDLVLSDDRLYIDGEVFRQMGGTYVFSRIAVSNADELGLTLTGVYSDESSPYVIYVYHS
jgi:hypothetical protein